MFLSPTLFLKVSCDMTLGASEYLGYYSREQLKYIHMPTKTETQTWNLCLKMSLSKGMDAFCM